jgi:hypothetical protein
VDDAEDSLRCAYEDCTSRGNLAFESLYGWDAYRQMHGDETADWPETPTAGECYRQEGALGGERRPGVDAGRIA